MDSWEKRKIERAKDERPRGDALPEKDIVMYIMRNSPHLQPWQRDVVAMIHREMEYFVFTNADQIMNEGWAASGIQDQRELTLRQRSSRVCRVAFPELFSLIRDN